MRIGVLASGNGTLLEAMVDAGLPVHLATAEVDHGSVQTIQQILERGTVI